MEQETALAQNNQLNLTLEQIIEMLEQENYNDEFVGNCIILIAYSLIIIISLLGNSLIFKVSIENRTTTNLLIASLSASDLMVTAINIPLNLIRLLMDEWPFGRVLCFLVPFIQIMAVYVSSLTMAVIAIHRWRAVTSRWPTRPCSRRCLCMTIIGTWLLAAIMAVPLSLFNQIQEVVIVYKPVIRCRNIYPISRFNISLILTIECFLTQYLLPLSLACILYVDIARIILKQGRIRNSLSAVVETKHRTERKRRRMAALILVVIVFAICWLPINFYHLFVDSRVMEHNYNLFLVCHWFAMSSVCYNPFIYCWLNSTFRSEVKKMISILKSFQLKRRVLTNTQNETNRSGNSIENGGLEMDQICETKSDNIRYTPTNQNVSINAVIHDEQNI